MAENKEAPWLVRGSRVREVQMGAPFWTSVDLIDIQWNANCDLRPSLERFGIRVNLWQIAQARHLAKALSQRTAPYLLICSHGGNGRLHVPELPHIPQPFGPRVGPDDIRGVAHLDGVTVITGACEAGDDDLAQAFLDCGAHAYVASTGAPSVYAGLFVPLFIFYELTEERTLDEAMKRLNAIDDKMAQWRLFRPGH
jgi:hypothetical protein